ncbi:MAG: hypothetical protein LRY73_03285 [Bacillus sp. (in: Bacteria)]|nr:hypothetical protein [Bacillus sp. (in: firmicutes)]
MNYMNMLGMKKNNNTRNGIMLTLVGVGVGAAAYSMMRGRNNGDIMRPIQRTMEQMRDQMS